MFNQLYLGSLRVYESVEADIKIAEQAAHITLLRSSINEAMMEQQHPFSASILQAALESSPKQSLVYAKQDAIREAAESVAKALEKENLPTIQALAMGRFYSELLQFADGLEKICES